MFLFRKFCNFNIIYLFFFINQLFSIRYFLNSSFFSKDVNFFFFYVLVSCLFFYILISKKIIIFFLKDYFLYLILLILLSLLTYNYPIQEDLKFLMQGSDQDNCYLDIINNIKNKKDNIYSISYLGNPCSTGLLGFIFYFPLIFWKNFFILMPVIFIIIFNLICKNFLKDIAISNLLTLLLLSNLVFLELAVSGSDFISISISYVAGNVLLIQGLKDYNKFRLIFSFLFFLFFFGSRSILLVLFLPLFGLYFYKYKSKILIYYFLLLSILVLSSFLIPYAIYLPNPFPPFHLFSKALKYLEIGKYIFILLIIIFILSRNLIFNLIRQNFILCILLILFLPLSFSGFSGFLQNINNLSKWEELNYLFLCLPTLYILSIFLFNGNKL